MKGILGTKVGMTQIFEKSGRLIPVTILHVEENQVISIKTKEKDGYDATLLGFKKVDSKKLNAPQKGLFKKTNTEPRKVLQEIRDMTGYSIGQVLKVEELFQQGQCVDVQGTTKGHGFTGAIKRWNFKIGPLGHGAGYPHRFQGSVQAGRGGSQAQRVFKGKKMSGHYGVDVCTIQNLSIVAFKPEENLVLVSGAVPGPSGQMVRITISKKHPNKIYTYDLVSLDNVKKSTTKVEPTKEEVSTNKPEQAKVEGEANE